MKAAILIICTCLLACNVCYADYNSMWLPELVKKSDIIAYGKIIRVDDNFFIFKMSEKLKGDYKDSIISIKKFTNWTCADRFEDYKIGQELVVFLENIYSDVYEALGAGNEGEIPVFNNRVYYGYQLMLSDEKPYTIYNTKINAREYTMKDFTKLLRVYLRSKS